MTFVSLPVRNARDFDSGCSPTAGIQEAIDSLPPTGGVVYLPAGTYLLRRSVVLRSTVTIRGDGPATVLTRPPVVRHRLVRGAHGESKHLRVSSTRGLQVGDQVNVRDRESVGWWSSHAIVTDLSPVHLRLEMRHGSHKYRFLPERLGIVTNWFPAIWLKDTHDVIIESLAIDGNEVEHPYKVCDFVVAAIHSHNCTNLRIANITVRHWPGDGIGIQGGHTALVTGCIVENCAGHGCHPGTGLTQSLWTDNVGIRNTCDGLFFCLRVTHSVVRGNVFELNGRHGIGGLSDPDMFNVVASNICANNGCHGIEAVRSIGNVIEGNILRNNSQKAPGRYAGLFMRCHRDTTVTGNICVDDQERQTQVKGMVSLDPAGTNIIANNQCRP